MSTVDVPNTGAGNPLDFSTTLPNLEGKLVLLTAPNFKAVVVVAKFCKVFTIYCEKATCVCGRAVAPVRKK